MENEQNENLPTEPTNEPVGQAEPIEEKKFEDMTFEEKVKALKLQIKKLEDDEAQKKMDEGLNKRLVKE